MYAYVQRMDEASPKRRYTLKERARSQAETRQRIVEAAVRLHEELGPRATTISAIAARAGVQRLTVYRHFPDEAAVFRACTSHWQSLNPPPNPAVWTGIDDPARRRSAALAAFFAYYRRTRGMLAVSHRDEPKVPALQGPMQAFRDHLDALAAALAADLGRRGAATLRHLLAFATWESLEGLGLSDDDKLALAESWLSGASAADGAAPA
jgi:AcrR family transcriptional regulator